MKKKSARNNYRRLFSAAGAKRAKENKTQPQRSGGGAYFWRAAKIAGKIKDIAANKLFLAVFILFSFSVGQK